MTTYSSSILKTWYVHVKMQDLCPNSTSDTGTKETFTADAVQKFLRENKIPVFIENGGMYTISIQRMQEGLNADFDSRDPTWRLYGYFLALDRNSQLSLLFGLGRRRKSHLCPLASRAIHHLRRRPAPPPRTRFATTMPTPLCSPLLKLP